MAGESLASWTQTPVTTGAEVRALSGYTEIRDIPDADVSAFILKAQAMTMSAIASRVQVPMWGTINGVNTRFAIPPRFQSRVILDSDNSGNGANDSRVTLEGPYVTGVPPTYTAATITSVDELNGVIILTAAPASATTRRVVFSGWLISRPISKEQFKTAVELLAAHLCDQRVRGPGAVVLSNPNAGTREAAVPRDRTWLAQWELQVGLLRAPRPRAASVRTAMRSYGLGRVECDDGAGGCWP